MFMFMHEFVATPQSTSSTLAGPLLFPHHGWVVLYLYRACSRLPSMYRLEDHEFEQAPCPFELLEQLLDVFSRWRWVPLLSLVSSSAIGWISDVFLPIILMAVNSLRERRICSFKARYRSVVLVVRSGSNRLKTSAAEYP
jgi:hypothetical protein